jgi:predicted regulator of Ras-like GTPase activity (Roadblock/LC7/MglB family)
VRTSVAEGALDMSDLHAGSRSDRLDRAIHALLAQTPEIEAAAVVSFDGLPMASALPPSMDEDRVAAMSAALLSLGERAAQGLGRGELSQVYIEGETGTVFLVSADNEAVLVAVAAQGAKVGMMLYEVRRAAAAVAEALRADDAAEVAAQAAPEPVLQAVPTQTEPLLQAVAEPAPMPVYTPQVVPDGGWTSYATTSSALPGDNPTWS